MNRHKEHGEEGVHEHREDAHGETTTLTDEMAMGPASDLEAKLAERDREIAELKDKYLRALADNENARKRIRQQSEESVRIQKEAFLRDLLPIVDNLERAVEASRAGGGDHQIVQGVEMVLRALLDFLKAQGVVPIQSAGQPFDPSRHEAIDQVASDSHPPNTVVSEFHRGYLIGERVLRPAGVSVARRPGERNGGES
jgi:molecular chaperone GrpE